MVLNGCNDTITVCKELKRLRAVQVAPIGINYAKAAVLIMPRVGPPQTLQCERAGSADSTFYGGPQTKRTTCYK